MFTLLMSILITGGIGIGAAYTYKIIKEDPVVDNEPIIPTKGSRTYKMIMKLLQDLQKGYTGFEPRNAFKTEYFDEHSAGNYHDAKIVLCGGYRDHHYVIVYAAGEHVMSFDFYPDGSIKEVKHKKNFLQDVDVDKFALDLKKAMEMFILQQNKVKQRNEKIENAFENINESREKEALGPFEKVSSLIKINHVKDAVVFKEVDKTIQLALELHKREEELDVEERHMLDSNINERLYNLLFHYNNLNKNEQEKRYDELLKGINQIHDKLLVILNRKKQKHEFEFEKQMKLIDK